MVWDPRFDSGSDEVTAASVQQEMACVCMASTHDEAIACRELLAGYSIPAVLGAIVRDTPASGVPVLVPEVLLDQANDVIACFDTADDPNEWSDEPLEDDDEDDDEDDEDDDYDYDDDDDYDDDLDDDFEDDFDDD